MASKQPVPGAGPRHEPDTARFKEQVLRAAIKQDLISDRQLLAGFIDTAGVSRTIDALISAFPTNFRHTFAAKANSLGHALKLVESKGLGCEVASAGELHQAIRAGFTPSQIVYDEPAKTEATLRYALENGVNFNIDNFQEYERVAGLIGSGTPGANIGRGFFP